MPTWLSSRRSSSGVRSGDAQDALRTHAGHPAHRYAIGNHPNTAVMSLPEVVAFIGVVVLHQVLCLLLLLARPFACKPTYPLARSWTVRFLFGCKLQITQASAGLAKPSAGDPPVRPLSRSHCAEDEHVITDSLTSVCWRVWAGRGVCEQRSRWSSFAITEAGQTSGSMAS